jgi:hypothetical protein
MSLSTGPVCSLKPVRLAPVRGLKELPHTGGFSIRERNELPSWVPGQSIIPTDTGKRENRPFITEKREMGEEAS